MSAKITLHRGLEIIQQTKNYGLNLESAKAQMQFIQSYRHFLHKYKKPDSDYEVQLFCAVQTIQNQSNYSVDLHFYMTLELVAHYQDVTNLKPLQFDDVDQFNDFVNEHCALFEEEAQNSCQDQSLLMAVKEYVSDLDTDEIEKIGQF